MFYEVVFYTDAPKPKNGEDSLDALALWSNRRFRNGTVQGNLNLEHNS